MYMRGNTTYIENWPVICLKKNGSHGSKKKPKSASKPKLTNKTIQLTAMLEFELELF